MFAFISKTLKNKKINFISILSLVFLSFAVVFPAGSFHSSSIVEQTSNYLAEVAKEHTKNGNYVALMIEPKEGTNKKIRDPYDEFIDLYGTFREGLVTYIGAANADKAHTVKLKGIEDDINFSFLNVDRGFGVQEAVDKDGNVTYRTSFYPLQLMFYSEHPYIEGEYSFLYISQSRANDLLDKNGWPHDEEHYRSLLNTLITIEIDDAEYMFAIDNIYLEQNYFYEAINEIMGEFFLAGARYPETIKKEAVFFLRQYPYQNKYYIRHATALYSQRYFNFKILDFNFLNNYKLNDSRVVFEPPVARNVVTYILIAFSIAALAAATALIYFGSFNFTIRNSLLLLATVFIPYLIFWIFYIIFKNVLLFSNFSTNFFILATLIFVAICFIVFLIKRNRQEEILQ